MAAPPDDEGGLVARLAAAGFVAPAEEAAELRLAAGGEAGRLERLVRRRLTGEPLAWVVGATTFCGERLRIDPGVYVPRPHTELLAARAVACLAPTGVAVDVCTGCGAVAAVLRRRRPSATVVATELDERAAACARANGVDVRTGDLLAPLPRHLRGRVDVLTAVVPYVPTPALDLLPRDTLAFETTRPYDGGPDGTALLRRVVAGAAEVLRPGGTLLLELGADQPRLLADDLAAAGFAEVTVLVDGEGDTRAVEARRRS